MWEVDVIGKDNKWHDVKIDATKGQVVKNRIDTHKDDDRSAPRAAELDAAAAGKKAAAVTKGSVTSLDLERNGQWEAATVDKQGNEHELNDRRGLRQGQPPRNREGRRGRRLIGRLGGSGRQALNR